MSLNFTTVIGVDAEHLPHLRISLTSWENNREDVTKHIIAFCDSDDVSDVIKAEFPSVRTVPWKPKAEYYPDGTRWTDPQRQKMLAGFVYTAAEYVKTDYWLKLDLDVLATPYHGSWIDPHLFDDHPAIVGHRWGYTKPSNQMMILDKWADQLGYWPTSPLNLNPNGGNLLSHERIISWCCFFQTKFTRTCRDLAKLTVGHEKLPVPSQDGYMWYVAKRLNLPVIRTNMKKHGWIHCSSLSKMKTKIEERRDILG